MRLLTLGSGSKGNATLIELGETRLLVDAGLSARQLALRLDRCGIAAGEIDGILVSHEHDDHARGLETFSRKHGIPVFCCPETLDALDLSPVHLGGWQPLRPGERLELGSVVVESFDVPHDAARPVGFVLSGEGRKIGVATDLGHVTSEVGEHLRGCDVMMIEFNHDDRMLQDGPYPAYLKQRVSGRYGHLSNREAARLLEDALESNGRVVVLAHLSEKNNTPDLARRRARDAVSAAGCRGVEIRVAEANGTSLPVQL